MKYKTINNSIEHALNDNTSYVFLLSLVFVFGYCFFFSLSFFSSNIWVCLHIEIDQNNSLYAHTILE